MILQRRKRLVVLHHLEMNESIEGIWEGMVGPHYRITAPKFLMPNNQTRRLEGSSVLVHKDKVAFVQVMAEDASA